MKSYTKSTYYSIFIASIICFLCLQNSYAQTEEQITESQENNQRLIRKGATYVGASVGLEIQKTKLPGGESEFNFNLGGKAQYAFSDYFAFGFNINVEGYRYSVDYIPSVWIYALGPSASFFIPTSTKFTPYISASGGFAQILIGKDTLTEDGGFYSGELGVIYEINHFFGVGLAYGYQKYTFSNDVPSLKAGGFALGLLFSF